VRTNVAFFFDELFQEIQKSWPALPAIITDEVREKFVAEYCTQLDLTVTTEQRFAQLQQIGLKHGFATNNAQFKEGWYIGKIWDLAMMLRILLCASAQTPDLYSVMQVMGKEMVERRLRSQGKK
jgi:glutamyl-tRNA synthetase